MKHRLRIVGILFLSAAAPCCALAVDVPKTNTMPVYMHYMPWFETPATLGGSNWGYHWKFNNRNPNIVDASGKRQIASHYYPMIGPYASSDADVIEYHLLLMKLSGVDGVMIDWYGVQGTNGDIVSLRQNSESLIRQVDDFGLEFSVMLEDRFTSTVANGEANLEYLRHNPNPSIYPNYPGYFENPAYTRLGAGQDPLLTVFGPITFQQQSQWSQILAQAGEDVNFLTLWYEKNDAGTYADGEYAWIYEDENLDNHLGHQANFLNSRAPTLGTAGGVAYPGFNDYYQEGGVENVVPFEIPHDNGQTLNAVLNQFQTVANQFPTRMDFLQLATFNDFSEGTMFEPTVETGFEYLKRIQQFTGVPYGESELELVYRLYLARKKYAGNSLIQANLDQVADLLASLDIAGATNLLDSTARAGDYDADGAVTASDYHAWRNSFGMSTIIYGSGANGDLSKGTDGDFNGSIDMGDYLVWRKSFDAAGGAGTSVAAAIPEPTSSALLLISCVITLCSFAAGRRERRR